MHVRQPPKDSPSARMDHYWLTVYCCVHTLAARAEWCVPHFFPSSAAAVSDEQDDGNCVHAWLQKKSARSWAANYSIWLQTVACIWMKEVFPESVKQEAGDGTSYTSSTLASNIVSETCLQPHLLPRLKKTPNTILNVCEALFWGEKGDVKPFSTSWQLTPFHVKRTIISIIRRSPVANGEAKKIVNHGCKDTTSVA